jgi:hypothetical protein
MNIVITTSTYELQARGVWFDACRMLGVTGHVPTPEDDQFTFTAEQDQGFAR